MAYVYDFNELNQAKSSLKLKAFMEKEGLVFSRGFRLGSSDMEVDVVEFQEKTAGVAVVDNADAQWSDLGMEETIDLLNTDELILSEL